MEKLLQDLEIWISRFERTGLFRTWKESVSPIKGAPSFEDYHKWRKTVLKNVRYRAGKRIDMQVSMDKPGHLLHSILRVKFPKFLHSKDPRAETRLKSTLDPNQALEQINSVKAEIKKNPEFVVPSGRLEGVRVNLQKTCAWLLDYMADVCKYAIKLNEAEGKKPKYKYRIYV